jgi:hypothetical protein
MKVKLLIIVVISVSVISLMAAFQSAAKIDKKAILGVWLFDEIIGGKTVKDSSKNGRDGILEGNTKLVRGKFGKALSFDGASAFVDVPVNLNECPEVTEVVSTYTHKPPPGERYQIISNDGGAVSVHIVYKNESSGFVILYPEKGGIGALGQNPNPQCPDAPAPYKVGRQSQNVASQICIPCERIA